MHPAPSHRKLATTAFVVECGWAKRWRTLVVCAIRDYNESDMSILAKTRALFGFAGGPTPRKVYETTVRCLRCGELLPAQINLLNDLSIDYANAGEVYIARKLVTGSGANRCFQTIELNLTFDKNRQLIRRSIQGGEFVDEMESAV